MWHLLFKCGGITLQIGEILDVPVIRRTKKGLPGKVLTPFGVNDEIYPTERLTQLSDRGVLLGPDKFANFYDYDLMTSTG